MPRAFAEIAFTPGVRAIQQRQGSARGYEKFLSPDADGGNRLGPAEAGFIRARDGFYQATVSETGWPYVQFRGGPAGFLRVIDASTIAYADYRGNRQYLSLGNLTGDDRIALILMDYPNRRRLKIWGRAKIFEGDEATDVLPVVHDPASAGRPERVIVITVEAFDWNCPSHIPQRLTVAEFEPYLAELRQQISELTAENARLAALAGVTS
ncbi:pyridoxamine 5'-phosphate oxidase family protein [Hoeflea ulvae]|uniref:Pyridoxamine 5'-phosphate oxidase family protein n=1 Tax=Hoeflea ulvae TaxID=2983764 RepID=A0ABT3YJW0_9HYPH|nr:pyridoxamine 5'-phosphate oxidase family protein [Hoeflea ulvae]MCY0096030.1 pyridoxamine 5'-phosphate oxidase family protein [Hoeflea ulvae]